MVNANSKTHAVDPKYYATVQKMPNKYDEKNARNQRDWEITRKRRDAERQRQARTANAGEGSSRGGAASAAAVAQEENGWEGLQVAAVQGPGTPSLPRTIRALPMRLHPITPTRLLAPLAVAAIWDTRRSPQPTRLLLALNTFADEKIKA